MPGNSNEDFDLGKNCAADTSFLSNFILSGNINLIQSLIQKPILLTPTVLNEEESDNFLKKPDSNQYMSELLRSYNCKSIKINQDRVRKYLFEFISLKNILWCSELLSESEIELASILRSYEIKKTYPNYSRKFPLDPGEAEIIAVAINRNLNVLIDDQSGIDLVKCLKNNIQILRTCKIITMAINQGIIDQTLGEDIFNRQICQELNFRCRKKNTNQKLVLGLILTITLTAYGNEFINLCIKLVCLFERFKPN